MDELELADRIEAKLSGQAFEEEAPEAEQPEAEGPPEEEAGSPGRARDEKGRFTAQQEEPQPEQDPVVQAFIDQHGGDVDKALRTAAHQTSMLGQQAQELGELRKAVEGLREDYQTEEYPVDDGLMSWAQQAAVENPVEAAMWSLKHQPAVYDTIMSQWYVDDPMGASRFERSLEMHQMRTQMQQELGPALAPAQEMHQRETFMQAWNEVAAEHPDMPQYADQILSAAQGAPEVLQALAGGDPAAKARVLRTLFFVARGQNLEALQAGAQAQNAEAAAQVRRQAAVGTMTSSAPPPPDGGGRTGQLDDWRRAFREEAGLPTDDLG